MRARYSNLKPPEEIYANCLSLHSKIIIQNILTIHFLILSGYRGGSSTKRREQKRFLMYGAYAWGVPAVLTAVTIGMQFGDNLPDHVITPGFGHRRCWFDSKESILKSNLLFTTKVVANYLRRLYYRLRAITKHLRDVAKLIDS